MRLIYWDKPNFGDLLAPFVVQSICSEKVQHKEKYLFDSINGYRVLFRRLRKFQFHKIYEMLFPWQKNLLAIGSVLSWGNKHSLIWGSGFMNENEKFVGGTIYALRGKYSNDKIKVLGFKGTSVFGDPAILLPLIVRPSDKTIYEVGLIPHWKETDQMKASYGSHFHVIDLRTRNILSVIHEITSCKYILSTSLHGIIVAHSYGIKALWIKEGDIDTDGIKFNDYFSSVNINPYVGFRAVDVLSNDNYEKLFLQYEDRCLPQINIQLLQKKLLKAFPYRLKAEYIHFISQ